MSFSGNFLQKRQDKEANSKMVVVWFHNKNQIRICGTDATHYFKMTFKNRIWASGGTSNSDQAHAPAFTYQTRNYKTFLARSVIHLRESWCTNLHTPPTAFLLLSRPVGQSPLRCFCSNLHTRLLLVHLKALTKHYQLSGVRVSRDE